MKQRITISSILKTSLLLLAISSIYAFGYFGGSSSSNFQDNTLTAKQAKVLVDNYQENASIINDKVQSVYISKDLLSDLNAMLSIKGNADGVRIYFGEEKDGETANLTVSVKGNSDDTSFILKSRGVGGICPTTCDAKSAIISE